MSSNPLINPCRSLDRVSVEQRTGGHDRGPGVHRVSKGEQRAVRDVSTWIWASPGTALLGCERPMRKLRNRRPCLERQSWTLQGSMSRSVKQGVVVKVPFCSRPRLHNSLRGNTTSVLDRARVWADVVSKFGLLLVARGSDERQQPGPAWLADKGCGTREAGRGVPEIWPRG
jgi:hypothetical protein